MGEWQDASTAPKEIVYREGQHSYGPYILGATTEGDVRRVRWWDAGGTDGRKWRNFLGDCGNAFHLVAWQPLPEGPEAPHVER